jgi:hypothetical protein
MSALRRPFLRDDDLESIPYHFDTTFRACIRDRDLISLEGISLFD